MIDPHPDCTRCNGTGNATEQHDFCTESGPCECIYRDENEPEEQALDQAVRKVSGEP